MISGPLTCEADGFAMGSGADMRRTNETYWMYLCLVIVKLREVQLSLWSAWSLLYRQKWGLLLFWVYFTAAQYPLPEEWSSRPAHFLLLPPVWWVLAETCCLGSSIMHPLPRDIMCDKWPISVQTPIGPWPEGGGWACVRVCVNQCMFVFLHTSLDLLSVCGSEMVKRFVWKWCFSCFISWWTTSSSLRGMLVQRATCLLWMCGCMFAYILVQM